MKTQLGFTSDLIFGIWIRKLEGLDVQRLCATTLCESIVNVNGLELNVNCHCANGMYSLSCNWSQWLLVSVSRIGNDIGGGSSFRVCNRAELRQEELEDLRIENASAEVGNGV